MKKGTLDYRCQHEECEHEFELSVGYTPIIPAQTYGPPENCYPEEGGGFEATPDECPKCGHTIDLEKAAEMFFDKLGDDRDL
jgi:hypothetical protein